MRGGFLSAFYPDEWWDSAYQLPYEAWYQEGKRGLIFDIDNTLVPHGAPADRRVVELFQRLHRLGFQTCLISNNQLPRVKPFAEAVESSFVENAHKPSIRNFLEACRRMGVEKQQALFIGDQLFTDVWGAKRAGIRSILVKPIHPKEEIQIVLKRRLEAVVLYFYQRHRKRNS